MIQKIILVLIFFVIGLSYQSGKEFLFELHASICPESHKELIATIAYREKRLFREKTAKVVLGKSKSQVLSMLGKPCETKLIESNPIIFGYHSSTFLKGDLQLHYKEPELIVCIRNNLCIATKLESHDNYKSYEIFASPEFY